MTEVQGSAADSGVRLLAGATVVLSACNTGRGRIKAEGVVGLTRGFLSANASCCIASLWSVSRPLFRVMRTLLSFPTNNRHSLTGFEHVRLAGRRRKHGHLDAKHVSASASRRGSAACIALGNAGDDSSRFWSSQQTEAVGSIPCCRRIHPSRPAFMQPGIIASA
eukprot:3021206-Rhodomonas_salina.1